MPLSTAEVVVIDVAAVVVAVGAAANAVAEAPKTQRNTSTRKNEVDRRTPGQGKRARVMRARQGGPARKR